MSAPNFYKVSTKQAVWMVMWRDPDNLAPFKGLEFPNSYLQDISPGISTSAISSSFLPNSHWERSLILDSACTSIFEYYFLFLFFLLIK